MVIYFFTLLYSNILDAWCPSFDSPSEFYVGISRTNRMTERYFAKPRYARGFFLGFC